MENNQNNNDLSFLKEQENAMSIKDIVAIFLRNFHWFVLSVAICMGIAIYKVHRQVPIYARKATVMLKLGPESTMSSGRNFEVMSSGYRRLGVVNTNLNNELIILHSRPLVRKVITELNLTTSYSYTTELMHRNQQLYTQSPIDVQFETANDYSNFNFTVTPVDNRHVRVADFGDGKTYVVSLNKLLKTPFGRIVIKPTLTYGPSYYRKKIFVTHHNIDELVSYYCSAISVSRASDDNTLINIAIRDVLPNRAEDILNTLIKIYNEDAIADKQKVIDYSAQFIEERIRIIDKDLESLEHSLDSFKIFHDVLDVRNYGTDVFDQSVSYTRERTSLENELSMSKFLLDQVKTLKKNNLLPVNIGVSESIEKVIDDYNENVLRLQRYEASGTTSNPYVQEMYFSLESMRDNIVILLNSQMESLKRQIQAVGQNKAMVRGQMEKIPTQQRYYLSVERIQKIKESLYLELLNRRGLHREQDYHR